MEPLEYVRIININLALLALAVNVIKGYQLKLHRDMNPDAMMGFLAVMSWCLAYAVAGTIAAFHDVKTGIWTLIMMIPVFWTLIAGLMGWHPKLKLERHDKFLSYGTMTANEMRERRSDLDQEK